MCCGDWLNLNWKGHLWMLVTWLQGLRAGHAKIAFFRPQSTSSVDRNASHRAYPSAVSDYETRLPALWVNEPPRRFRICPRISPPEASRTRPLSLCRGSCSMVEY